MLLCKFCGKICKNLNSQGAHQRLCKSNPNRIKSNWYVQHAKKNIPNYIYPNQYVKAKKLGLPKPILSNEARQKISFASKNHTPESKTRGAASASKTIIAKIDAGTWHTGLAKNMHIKYNGVDLHGTWELKYAQYLDRNNIKWIRNKDIFRYNFEGKERRYTPDFYLLDTDEYVEIKGYKTKKDEAKWRDFPKHRKLIVLMQKELKALKIL